MTFQLGSMSTVASIYVVSLVATVVLQLSCFFIAFACQIDKITV
jgi:hypothetical protein